MGNRFMHAVSLRHGRGRSLSRLVLLALVVVLLGGALVEAAAAAPSPAR